MTDIIGRLLDEAEKAQRKGHLLLAAVCRDASDQLGLITEERDRLRAERDRLRDERDQLRDERDRLQTGMLQAIQHKNKCNATGTPCVKPRARPCVCGLEAEIWSRP